ncbi:MAG: hypothetical protein KDD43_11870 [Bdellovibrionales bacterium]|nr:hypothetical protein [Bdellovibrionales bacterium]
MKAFRLILSVVLILGFYLGLQIGGPWWDKAHFGEGRIYQLAPINGKAECSDPQDLLCRRELVFDTGGRVLLVEADQGRSGTYRLKGTYLLLSLKGNEGAQEEISLLIQEEGNLIVEPGGKRSWKLQKKGSRGDS